VEKRTAEEEEKMGKVRSNTQMRMKPMMRDEDQRSKNIHRSEGKQVERSPGINDESRDQSIITR
jgi:hypothetical protein